MLGRIFLALIFTIGAGLQASACEWQWSGQSVKISEFVDGKTIFWGRAKKFRDVKKIYTKDLRNVASAYQLIEVIKSIQGTTKKTVKVWKSDGTCSHWAELGSIQLFITTPYGKNDFYMDQFLMQIARDDKIVAYLEEGLDWVTYGHSGNEALSSLFDAECVSHPNCKNIEDHLQNITRVYNRELRETKTLNEKKPWWKFRLKK